MVYKMNAEDMQLMKDIISQIGNMSNGNKVLFTVNYAQIAKTNLIVLKALLEELKKKGIFITIDRPHQYIEHLLRLHRIDYSNLLFIDTIARFSGTKVSEIDDGGNVRIMNSPFQIDLLPELFFWNSGDKTSAESRTDIADVDFILIDNLATMLSYNAREMVERFLEKYMAKFGGRDNILIPLILDSNAHQPLYEMAKKLCDKEIDINELRIGKSNRDDEMGSRSLLSDKKRSFDLYSYRKCFTGGG